MSKAQQAVLAMLLVFLGVALGNTLLRYPFSMPSLVGEDYAVISHDGIETDLSWVLERCKEGKEYLEEAAGGLEEREAFDGYYDEDFVRLRLAWYGFGHIENAITGEEYGYPGYLGARLIRKHILSPDSLLPSYARVLYTLGWACMMLMPTLIALAGAAWFISLKGRCKCE